MADAHDMTVPYTEEEIKEMLDNVRKFDTYDGTSIAAEEIPRLCSMAKYKLTPEQEVAYVEYFKRHTGRHSLTLINAVAHVIHSPALHAREYALLCDKNNDGVISREEFDDLYSLMAGLWPHIAGKTFDDFVREADTNRSGDVDIDEFVAWLANTTERK